MSLDTTEWKKNARIRWGQGKVYSHKLVHETLNPKDFHNLNRQRTS